MKYAGILLSLWLLMAGAASAGSLSQADAADVRADISAMIAEFEAGNADAVIERTHPSLAALAGGHEAFAAITRQALAQVATSGVKFVNSEVGEPTQTYSAGDEEVCFVPKTAILEVQGKRAKSISFMVAIRKVGGGEWTYLDGAGLRSQPEMLYRLLPALARDIPFPPNLIEKLE